MDNVIIHGTFAYVTEFGSLGLITSHKTDILVLIVHVALQVCMQNAKSLTKILDNLWCEKRA